MSTVTDPIADFLTRVRNGARAQRSEVLIPVFEDQSRNCTGLERGRLHHRITRSTRAARIRESSSSTSLLTGRARSQDCGESAAPGLRRYVGADEIPRVLGGMGMAILSTSRGVVSGREARKQKLGGELLAYVW